MTIVDGALLDYACPFQDTYRTATATHDTREGLIVHVATDTGHLGLGEAAPLSNRTESLAECRQALETALATLEDGDRTIDEALADVDELVPEPRDHRAARFGLALALADAQAKKEGRPLAEGLAERHLDGRNPAPSVPVNATIPDRSLEETRAQARRAAKEGFEVIKLKAGRQGMGHDIDRLDAVTEAAPDARIRLDVNGAWRDVDTAMHHLAAIEGYPLDYVEQPLPPDDVQGMAKLRARSDVPIAADEPARDVRSARALVLARACDVLVVKPMVLGGLDHALKVARLAELEDVDVVVTTTIDAAVARAGTLHVAAALGPTDRAHGLATGWMLEEDPTTFDERIEEGHVALPREPGHGARRVREESTTRTLEEP